jgi:DNA helicase HerA-like ATPase
MLISFPELGHTSVLARTREGKTYATIKSLEAQKEPVLFFNTQLEAYSKRFLTADQSYGLDQITEALHEGFKINFMPSDKPDRAAAEFDLIVDELYTWKRHYPGMPPIYFVIDEVHLLQRNKDARNQLIRLASTGLKWGIRCIFISQRPAMVDNTLLTQSTFYVLFATGLESGWFKRYNMPYDDIQSKLQKKYQYVTFDMREVRGAYKV